MQSYLFSDSFNLCLLGKYFRIVQIKSFKVVAMKYLDIFPRISSNSCVLLQGQSRLDLHFINTFDQVLFGLTLIKVYDVLDILILKLITFYSKN